MNYVYIQVIIEKITYFNDKICSEYEIPEIK